MKQDNDNRRQDVTAFGAVPKQLPLRTSAGSRERTAQESALPARRNEQLVDRTTIDINIAHGMSALMAVDVETRLLLDTMVTPEPLDEEVVEAWLDKVGDQIDEQSRRETEQPIGIGGDATLSRPCGRAELEGEGPDVE